MMISATDGSYAEVQAYARRVARSHYRPPLDQGLPKELMDLVKRCWDPKAELRPSMSEVIKTLSEINNALDWTYWEKVWAAQWQEDVTNDVQVIKPESMILTSMPSLKPTSGIITAVAGDPIAAAVARPVSQASPAQLTIVAPALISEPEGQGKEADQSGKKAQGQGCQCIIA